VHDVISSLWCYIAEASGTVLLQQQQYRPVLLVVVAGRLACGVAAVELMLNYFRV